MKLPASLLSLSLLLPCPVISSASPLFEDAKWIGAGGDDLQFYSPYLPVFVIDCDITLPAGSKAALCYGIDDPRLMDRNMNIYGIESAPDTSFVKVELTGEGQLAVFRSGYHPEDNPLKPLAVFQVDSIHSGSNSLTIASCVGETSFFIDGRQVGDININPVGKGGDFIAFPVLADMAVEIPEGSQATFTNLRVTNLREPRHTLCSFPGAISKTTSLNLPVKSLPELKTRFTLPEGKKVKEAVINATARGIYDLYINGLPVTTDYFNPGSTQYNKTHLYQTFDVTPLLREGANTISAQLGEGWWTGGQTYTPSNWNFYGDRPSLLAEMTVSYTDGTSETLSTTPGAWTYSVDGPVIEGSFFQGEVYDASRQSAARKWLPAVEILTDSTVNLTVGDWQNVNIRPSFGDNVRAVDTLTAVSMTEPRPGVYVYDMGQNMAGVHDISFGNLRKGQNINMRFAEVLYPEMPSYQGLQGIIMTENLRAAMCRDIYMASGDGQEQWSPRYTLHGFRFIELTGLDSPLPTDSVRALVISSVPAFRAHFECSDTLVNRLWENIKWSTRSNFISIPTDCPQRNERLGWMGDISVFAPTATKIADVSALLTQFLTSVRDCQTDNGRYPDVAPSGSGFGGLLWGSAGITVPWEHFSQYSDTTLLTEHYPSMKRYIDYLLNEAIDPSTGIIVQGRYWGGLSDWLSPEYNANDPSLLWECYFIYDLDIMRRVATLLGHAEDAARYEELLNSRKKFFVDNYVDERTGKTVFSAYIPDKTGQVIDTQASYALPIAMDIYSTPLFVENFVNTVTRENHSDDGTVCPPYSLMTGFIGTAWIMEALSKTGNTDTAYRLLTSTHYPSWLYPVTQGATTVWERLNSYTHEDGFGDNNSMNSFNHYSFGSVGNWLLTRALGFRFAPDGSVTVEPQADPSGHITFARGWIDTPKGRIESGWHIDPDGKVIYEKSSHQ